MAEKTLKTRIKLRYDSYTNWTTKNPVLLAGEIAVTTIASGATQTVNSVTPPQVLLKVGDGTTAYNSLPWASGLAADVHSWAKAANKPEYTYAEITGTPTIGNGTVTVKQNGTPVGSFTLNQDGPATIELTDTADTNTTYKISQNGLTLTLLAQEKGSSEFTAISTINLTSFVETKAKDAADVVLGTAEDGAEANTVYGAKAAAAAAQATANSKYTKPESGIAKTDLAADVQTSLGKADSSVQSVVEGSTNGTIAVDGTDVAVHGLGTAAYKAETYFAKQDEYSATAAQVATNTQDITDLKETVTGGMHFKGKFDDLPATTTYNAGDFVIVGSKEYILFVDKDSSKSWVELGDEGSHLTKAQADGYYVAKNNAITAGTHTKITYDAKGLVTDGADLAASDIPDLDASKITSGTLPDARIASAANWNAKQDATDDRISIGDTTEKTVVGAINKTYALAKSTNGTATAANNTANGIKNGTIAAGKATADGDGNVIKDTYATIATVNGKQDAITAENKLSLDLVSGWGEAAKKDVDTSIAANSTSTNLPTSKAVEDRINAHAGIDKVGTVTTVAAGTGLKITGDAATTPTVDIDESVVFIFDCGTSDAQA